MTRIRRALFTVAFWLDAAERAAKSFAQGTLTAWGLAATPVLDATFPASLVAGASMAVLSVLTSVASAGRDGSASLVGGQWP